MTEVSPNNAPLFSTLEEGRLLQQAISKARATVRAFTDAFVAQRHKGAAYFVKLPLVDTKSENGVCVWTERIAAAQLGGPDLHLWLRVHDVLDDLLFVHVFESPQEVVSLSVDQTFVVEASGVEDWTVIDGGLAYGGYTLRLQRDTLSEQARLDFDAHTGIQRFSGTLP